MAEEGFCFREGDGGAGEEGLQEGPVGGGVAARIHGERLCLTSRFEIQG